MGLLDGKIAIVTGGASGIGRATALRFAAEGARVCVADLNADGAKQVAEEIAKAGGEAIARAVDVSDVAANDAMVEGAVERFGALHVAFLNAGIAAPSAIFQGSVEDWDRVVAVNLRGVFLGMRATSAALARSGGGAIVVTASVAGLVGGRGMPSYYASKHGVVGLVKAAAAELAPLKIRVNAVCPGVIDTPILGPLHGVKAVMEGPLARMHPIGRVGQPDDVARLVSFLASERASFMTGGAYVVDGGLAATLGGGGDDAMNEQMLMVLSKLGQPR
jgi:NAD(P)-dependent dehydrogenase (short-subunit alcohol dehydrogenase family)